MVMPLHIRLITLFPEMFPGHLGLALAGKALEKKIWSFECINPRDFATDPHKTVDDTPFGGGAGMVMKPDILTSTLESMQPLGRFLYMSPRGVPLTQNLVQELTQEKQLTVLCGRYEGVDQRVLDYYQAEEVSVGDYVLSGGEAAALTLMDACIRLIPGVLGNDATHMQESFTNDLLEYPHYTRPAAWTAPDGHVHNVPNVLTSGHHGNIDAWRREQSESITKKRRPDLLDKHKNKAGQS